MNLLRVALLFLFYEVSHISTSEGDRSPFYQKCVKKCINNSCKEDGYFFKDTVELDVWSRLLWNCRDECRYNCMWRTVQTFQERGYLIPKFHGKWPFVRIYGVQEPGSAFASLLNLAAHVYMYADINRRFSIKSTPLVLFWHIFAAMRHCSHVRDCFLWEEVKRRDVVEAQSLEDLTIKNNNAFSEVKSDTTVLNKLNYNLMKCARLCLDRHGLYFEQILKYMVCINAWFWSAIFHTRDNPFTEFMDYACALSMVMGLFIAAVVRVFHRQRKLAAFMVIGPLLFYAAHVQYLYLGIVDYDYNMLVNLIFGVAGALVWLCWAACAVRAGRAHAWRAALFTALSGAALALELLDFPPAAAVWDAHALWHLATAPLPLLFYRFVIDDLYYLQSTRLNEKTNLKLT